MSRFTLTADESRLIGIALLEYAIANNLTTPDALVAAANATSAELKAIIQARLLSQKVALENEITAFDARCATTKNALITDVAAIDSALTKL